MPPRSQTQPSLVTPHTRCGACQHIIVTAVTDQGARVQLDTQMTATWVITGRLSKEGLPIAVPSRGYPQHPNPCVGARS